MKKNQILLFLLLGVSFLLYSCNNDNLSSSNTTTSEDNLNNNNEVFSYSKMDKPDIYSYYENQSSEQVSYDTKLDISSLNSTYLISEGGTYLLEGTNTDLSLTINSTSEIKLILNNVNIVSNQSTSVINVETASSFSIYLPSKTKNYLADSTSNTLDGVINVKKTSLNIYGEGYLIITSNGIVSDSIESGKGIHCSKTINITNSNIVVNSSNDHALNGKEGLSISSAHLDVTSNADGIHSKEGTLVMSNSLYIANTKGDGIDITTSISITSCEFYIYTTGEFTLYQSSLDTDGTLYEDSKYIYENNEYKKISTDDMTRYSTRYYLAQKCKAIKSDGEVSINDGKYYLYSTDDAIASDTLINIYDGLFEIYTLDQGINCDQTLNIGQSGSTSRNQEFIIKIFNSFEGIQGGVINFYDGYTYIISSDDGINATSDTLTSYSMNFYTNSYVVINAEGDGIDSNGEISLDGGTLVVFGPQSDGNSALDYETTFTINSGDMLAISCIGMQENPNDINQNIIVANINSSFTKNDIINFVCNDYQMSLVLPKSYNNVCITYTSSNFITNSSYVLSKNGNVSNGFKNYNYIGLKDLNNETSLYNGTISSTTTTIGSNSNPGGGQPGGNPGRR